jgi:hypothetical protein
MAAVVAEARTVLAEAVTAAVVAGARTVAAAAAEARTVVAEAALAAAGEARTEVVHTDTKFPATARPKIWGGLFFVLGGFRDGPARNSLATHVFSTVTDLGPLLIGHTGKAR